MSKITLTPHASGTGTLNIAAPNTNSTRTLTLPDADLNLGNVLTTSSSVDAANLTGALPAIDGSAVTSLTSANLTGALPAIDGSALTGVGASTTYGAVGTYVFATQFVAPNSAGTTENTTVAGSGLKPSGIGINEVSLTDDNQTTGQATNGGSALSGTWRSMGRANASIGVKGRMTLFVRTV